MKNKNIHKMIYLIFSVLLLFAWTICDETEVNAATFPAITVDFDEDEQSVIVSGVPEKDASGNPNYMLKGYLNYGNERVETFCYAPSVAPYHIAEKQAYIFNWSDREFLLPCSGEYQFTAYLVYGTMNGEESGPKTTINITLTKKDESTNWGPGLPNTTVEVYDLNQMKGLDKNIRMEEDGYIWTINGTNITSPPEQNISLAITKNPENFPTIGVDDFFGNTVASKFTINHDGEFGFAATLDYFIGTDYSGKYANLFYVAGDGTFQFVEGKLVDDNGSVSYTFVHASDYIIAITDIEYTGQELNTETDTTVADTETDTTDAGAETDTTDADAETDTTDVDTEIRNTEAKEEIDKGVKNANNILGGLIGLIVVFVGIAVVLFIKRKKNKQIFQL